MHALLTRKQRMETVIRCDCVCVYFVAAHTISFFDAWRVSGCSPTSTTVSVTHFSSFLGNRSTKSMILVIDCGSTELTLFCTEL